LLPASEVAPAATERVAPDDAVAGARKRTPLVSPAPAATERVAPDDGTRVASGARKRTPPVLPAPAPAATARTAPPRAEPGAEATATA
jgi:hypothetical protein